MAPATRTVHVEQCMGTVFTIDIRDDGDWQAATAEVVTWLHHVDAVFSTYRADSAVSLIRSGVLRAGDAHPDVLTVLDLCAEAQLATSGAFSAMTDGALDPTGLVKGWAVERASAILRGHGSSNHAVNGGGDLQLAGYAGAERPWAVGIVDPADRTQVLTVVRGCDLAVATSGTAERGSHIVDPFTGRPATDVLSATVVGPSLAFADAYATAAAVLGAGAIAWIDGVPDHEALVVTSDGRRRTSRRWGRFTGVHAG